MARRASEQRDAGIINSSPSERRRLGSSDVFTTVTLNLKYVGQAEGEAPTRPNLNRMRQPSQV